MKVLIVDDEKMIRDFLTRLLSLEGIETKTAESGFEAIEAAKKERFEVVFMDVRMPGIDGIRTFRELKKIDPYFTCVFMSGYAVEEDLFRKAMQPGDIFLRKPFEDIRKINEMVINILREAELHRRSLKSTQEKRAYIRWDLELEADYKLKEREGPAVSSVVKNISFCGVKLLVREELAAGAILDLLIKAPGREKTNSVVGKVIWSKKAKEKQGYYYAGIEFIEIDYVEFGNFINSLQ